MAPLFSSFYCPQCEKTKTSAAGKTKITVAEFILAMQVRSPYLGLATIERWADRDLVTITFPLFAPAKSWIGLPQVKHLAVTIPGTPSMEDVEYWEKIIS